MTILPPNVYQGIVEDTPIGPVRFALSSAGLVVLSLGGDEPRFLADIKRLTKAEPVDSEEKTKDVARQIQAYFDGSLETFDVKIDWSIMSVFQAKALKAVFSIPYGRYLTYKEVAHEIGQPKAVRAVGRAKCRPFGWIGAAADFQLVILGLRGVKVG